MLSSGLSTPACFPVLSLPPSKACTLHLLHFSLNIFPVNCAFYETLSTWNQTTWLYFWNYFPFNFLRLAMYWHQKLNNITLFAGFGCDLGKKIHIHANVSSFSITTIGRKREEKEIYPRASQFFCRTFRAHTFSILFCLFLFLLSLLCSLNARW